MEIGRRIKELRELRGLTLEQVGDYVGVNKATVQRYEVGNIDIKRNIAIKLAEVLKTTPAYIMGWCDSPERDGDGVDVDPDVMVICASPYKDMLATLEDALAQLNDEGREKLLDYAADLVASGRYIKSRPAGMAQKEA